MLSIARWQWSWISQFSLSLWSQESWLLCRRRWQYKNAEWVCFLCCRTDFIGISQKMGHRATINMCFHQREMFQRGFVRIQLIFELKMHQFINAFHQIQHSWHMSRLVSTGVAEDCVCTRWMNAAACCVYTVSNPARASFIQKTISISLQHIFPLSPRRLFSLR